MSSNKLLNTFDEKIQKEIFEMHLNLSEIVIPFSKLFRKYETSDIYSGNEKIPFKERDPEYKMILRQEFANILKVEFKVYKSVIKFPTL